MKILLFSYLLLQIRSSVYAAATLTSRNNYIESSSGSIISFVDSISVETPYFNIDEYADGLLVSLNDASSLVAGAKKPEPLRLETPVACSALTSIYTTTLMPTPGPFGIYTITTTKTKTIPLTTTTATTTITKTITTDGFDFFGQRRTTTVYNIYTTTETDISSTTIVSTKPAAPATPTTQYITVPSSKEYVTVTSTQSKEIVTITATLSKEFITVISTPSKETVTVTASPSTVTAIPQTITTTVTTTKAAGGIFDGNILGGATKTITFDNTITLDNIITKSEVSKVTVTNTQPFTLTETITASCPLPPLPIQTILPGLPLPDTMNILRIIFKVIQDLQGDKPQFNPVVELIKTVIQQAIKQDDKKNVQAILSFVFDLIQKNSSQISNNHPFPFIKRLLIKDDFEAQAREWLTNQFIDII